MIFEISSRDSFASYLPVSAPARHSFSDGWFICGFPFFLQVRSRSFVSIRGSSVISSGA
jgi:hypothetical protein